MKIMRKEDAVDNDFISAQCIVDSTLMKNDAGCWIQMQGHGGRGRCEDKLKKVWHRWSWQSVWLA